MVFDFFFFQKSHLHSLFFSVFLSLPNFLQFFCFKWGLSNIYLFMYLLNFIFLVDILLQMAPNLFPLFPFATLLCESLGCACVHVCSRRLSSSPPNPGSAKLPPVLQPTNLIRIPHTPETNITLYVNCN